MNNYNIKGRIVSDNWWKTLYLSYYLNCKFYGIPRENITNEELQKDLIKYNIDYYFLWNKYSEESHLLSNYRELTNGAIPDLRIYSIKERIK